MWLIRTAMIPTDAQKITNKDVFICGTNGFKHFDEVGESFDLQKYILTKFTIMIIKSRLWSQIES
jgi:hypothetical protein